MRSVPMATSSSAGAGRGSRRRRMPPRFSRWFRCANARRRRSCAGSSTNTPFRAELDPAWAVRPTKIVRSRDRTTLVLEDPGALLAELIRGPMEIVEFFRVSIGLAGALRKLHERGLIHSDIKPANALVDRATGCVWLTGFGITSPLQRERQAPEPLSRSRAHSPTWLPSRRDG
jgi:Protein kinase domain